MSKICKIGILIFAIFVAGIFGLPSTISLFSGQHTWYNLNGEDNNLPCEKCHADINDEMVSGDNGVHTTLAGPGCDCHRVSGTGVASGDGAGNSIPGTRSHAAETVACMLCHENNSRTGEIYPFAGGFDTAVVYDFPGAPAEQYNYSWGDGTGGEHAAHNQFIREAIKDELMEDSNEACIACHTRIGVNITWKKKEYLKFTVYDDEAGVWTISDFTAGGENVTQVNTSNSWTNS